MFNKGRSNHHHREKRTILTVFYILSLLASNASFAMSDQSNQLYFNRIATFPVFENTSIELETVAEIVAASEDGQTLIYTDSETGKAGLVDISNPRQPKGLGTIELNGEPTSVAVAGNLALVCINTSPTFTSPSGQLVVIDLTTKNEIARMELGGQADAIAISPSKQYAAIAIENERDEDLGNGEPPQAPAGFLAILDMMGGPEDWTIRSLDLRGIPTLFADDPEPEYVSINQWNIAAVTLQENNEIILVHLPTGHIINHFSAGSVDLEKIDTTENNLIELSNSLVDVPREPDGITWVSPVHFATADEGDLFGGSRSFTIFNLLGKPIFSSGHQLDHLAAQLGHYPEERSENKGNEPENVAFSRYGKDNLLFVGSERANLVFVYQLHRHRDPKLLQILPTGVGPEGLLPIPDRDLFVAASEKDDRGDKFRSSLSIYKRTKVKAKYPTIVSNLKPDQTPIPWGALSGLAVGPKGKASSLFTIHDSFYQKSRIYPLDATSKPAKITGEILLKDTFNNMPSNAQHLVASDDSVSLDLEGISVRSDNSFWLVSEGSGSVNDPNRPVASPNLLLQANIDGTISSVISLPPEVNDRQIRFGFEGVTQMETKGDEVVVVAFQREWLGDAKHNVRIGFYSVNDGTWRFLYYPIEEPTSDNGGWVGLSDISYIGDQRFAVIERDNQGGTDASIKRIYSFSIQGKIPSIDTGTINPNFDVVEKQLEIDLMPTLAGKNGAVLEKIEGLTVLKNGTALIVNDNDGVDDSNGETQLIRLRKLFK